jgi:hypothetical protein
MRVAKSVTMSYSYACETWYLRANGSYSSSRLQATTHGQYGKYVRSALCRPCFVLHVPMHVYTRSCMLRIPRPASLTKAKLVQRTSQSQEFVDFIYAFKTTQLKR